MAIEACESKTQEVLPFPIGWFSVGRSRDLQTGEVKRAFAFDRELALFRTRAGNAVVTDAFCPHLGAHLGVEGVVVGESIRCPFHGWRYGTDGRCVEIPYCDEIPERARVRAWPVTEANGEIMVWYHPEEKPPAWEVPVVEELASDEWTPPRLFEFTVPNHVQNIAENTCDPVHFQFVHKQPHTPPTEINIDEDGRILRMVSDASEAKYPSELTATMYNLGLAVVRTTYGPGAEMIVYNTAQPTTHNETHLRWQLTVRNEIADMVGDDVMRGITDGVMQDFPIWQHKVYRTRPVFCKADTSLVGFRKWVRQFYV